MAVPRRFTTVVDSWTEVEAPSAETYLLPVALPETQKEDPFTLAAPRGVAPLPLSVKAIEVSVLALASTRPTVRGVVVVMPPTLAPWPIITRYRLSVDRVSNPSEVEVPAVVS